MHQYSYLPRFQLCLFHRMFSNNGLPLWSAKKWALNHKGEWYPEGRIFFPFFTAEQNCWNFVSLKYFVNDCISASIFSIPLSSNSSFNSKRDNCLLTSFSIILSTIFRSCTPFASTLAPFAIEIFTSCLIVPRPLFTFPPNWGLLKEIRISQLAVCIYIFSP